jgi:hypothetical protein
MNNEDFDTWLDRSARNLPTAIEPERDLWPQIEQRLHEDEHPVASHYGSRLWPFAAGIAATVLLTVAIAPLRDNDAPVANIVTPEPIVLVEEAPWVPEIRRTRNQLSTNYEVGLASLAPETRQVVEENLTKIHESMAQIHAALAEDPGNLALHRLLASTYAQEIELISTIGAMTSTEQGL